ncbi:MAG: plasma-membrane proton-efflux P-type ATPase [Nitrososphaeria archaeon]
MSGKPKGAEEYLRELGTDLSKGLSSDEVKRRQVKYGLNEVVEKRQPAVIRLLRKFWGLTSWMLEVTMILTLVLRRFLDFYLVTALLLVNVFLGFMQEERANRALEALKQRLHVNSRVLRDGRWDVVPARELVPGDIVRIRAGDFVPADLVIYDGEVEVDQSALTGESLTVTRTKDEQVFSGSIIRRGEATGIVIATGPRTYFGRTTELVKVAKPKLHMEEVISQVVKWLLVMVVLLLGAALGLSALQGAYGVKLFYLLPLALVLLVSAIPVALPAMFTVTMALGSMELAKKGVLVTRLSASEDAASMDTLCVDKTGTITMNRLSVVEVAALDGHNEQEVLLYGALASQEANQDPIDMAFIRAAKESSIDTSKYSIVKFVPFDPSTRRTEAQVQLDGKLVTIMKGAVDVIVKMCQLPSETRAKVDEVMRDFASKGYRSIAVGIRVDSVAELVGIAALYDKPRPDSPQLISELKNLGVSVKMLTGDTAPIALETAKRVGLGTSVADAREVMKIQDERLLAEKVESADVFAEIYPEDKYRIVKALQSKKHIVGMTGDGVNDAPALKQAEVGIAVSNATDVAKAAASVVLTKEGLINIVDLVKTGRMIFQRITTWIFNKVVKTFQIVVFVVLSYFIWGKFVVGAFDVLLLLFLIDFVTISISTDNVRWSRRPDKWDVNWLVKVSVLIGVATVLESLFITYLGARLFNIFSNVGELHTYGFDILMFFGMFTIFVVRERGRFWSSRPSNILLLSIIADIAVAFVISVIGIPGLQPIPWQAALLVLMLSFIFAVIVNDNIKLAALRILGVQA